MPIAPFRSDVAELRLINNEIRTPDRLRAHYVVERELAGCLLNSTMSNRTALYTTVYNELFHRVSDHPQHRIDLVKRSNNTASQIKMLGRFLHPGSMFVEVGCGDAAVAKALAPSVREAVGVDVTPVLVSNGAAVPNFRFVQTDGTMLDLQSGQVDVVYSNQLMEHLHPEDADAQLREVCRILKPGGLYICCTPNRITGPHDISGYFGFEPSGFHLCEYDHGSLAQMFRKAGFQTVRAWVGVRGHHASLPVWPVALIESLVSLLPQGMRARLAKVGPIRSMAGLTLLGQR